MDLKTIKTFKTVVKFNSFQRAAEALNYAQSTITMHIKSLEEELNVTLLERGKNFQLTEAGRLLNEKGDLLLKGFDSLKNAMEELLNGESGVIRLGVMEPTASYRIPTILKQFTERYPKIQLSIQIHSNNALIDMVKKEEIDLALCTAPEMSLDTVFLPFFQENVVLLVPESHPLSGNENVYLRNLQDENLLTTSTVCPFRRNFEKQAINAGINPHYGIEISNMLGLKYYVQEQYGIAVVPLIAVTPSPEGTIIKQIMDFEKGLTVGLLRKADSFHDGVAMKFLIEVIQKHLGSLHE